MSGSVQAFRVFVYKEICQQLRDADVKALVYTQPDLPGDYHVGKTAIDVLLKLEMKAKYSAYDVTPLRKMMKEIGRDDLAKKVKNWKKQKMLIRPVDQNTDDTIANLQVTKIQARILLEQTEELRENIRKIGLASAERFAAEAVGIIEGALWGKLEQVSRVISMRQDSCGSSDSSSSPPSSLSSPPSSFCSSEDWTEIRSPVATLERQPKHSQNGRKANSLPRDFNQSEAPKARKPLLPPSQKKPVDDDYEEIGPPTTNPTLFARPPPMPSLYYSAVDVTPENRSDSNKGQLVTGRDGVRAKLPPPTAPKPKTKTSPSVSDLSGGSDFTGGSIDTSTGDSGFVDAIRYRKKTPGQKNDSPPRVKPRHYAPLQPEQRDKLGYYKTARPEDNPTLAGVFELMDQVPEESPYVNVPYKQTEY